MKVINARIKIALEYLFLKVKSYLQFTRWHSKGSSQFFPVKKKNG